MNLLKVSGTKKKSKNYLISIFGVEYVCSHKYRSLIKNCTSYPRLNSQIWLNLNRDGCNFFLHLPMGDRHLGYIKKIH
jgi:hypothetical protein